MSKVSLTKKILFLLFSGSFLLPFTVSAQILPLPTSALPGAAGVVEIQALEQVFANVLSVATAFAGLAAFIVLISGSYKWLTSGGDPKKLESAKQSLTYAFLGLILLILIWFILVFIANFTGRQELLKFSIPK